MEILNTEEILSQYSFKEIMSACRKIVRKYIKRKIMGPLYHIFIIKPLQEKSMLIARDDNKNIIGFLTWKEYKKEQNILLEKMALREDLTGKGIGTQLLNELKKVAKNRNRNIRLRVAKINDKGINFYKKHGFQVTDTSRSKITTDMFLALS